MLERPRGTEYTNLIEAQNPFGFNTPGYQELNREQQMRLWIEEGGKDFMGEVGEVRRYVIGIPPKAIGILRTDGFDVNKKREMSGTFGKLLPFLSKHLGGTEGKGVYATTNPVLAAREYGPALAVVDIALGRTLSPDNNAAFGLLNTLHGPLFAGTMAYSEAALAVAFASVGIVPQEVSYLIGGSVVVAQLIPPALYRFFQAHSKADSMIVYPRRYWTIINKISHVLRTKQNIKHLWREIERHKQWVVVRDPKRVKVVNLFLNYDAYQKEEHKLTLNALPLPKPLRNW